MVNPHHFSMNNFAASLGFAALIPISNQTFPKSKGLLSYLVVTSFLYDSLHGKCFQSSQYLLVFNISEYIHPTWLSLVHAAGFLSITSPYRKGNTPFSLSEECSSMGLFLDLIFSSHFPDKSARIISLYYLDIHWSLKKITVSHPATTPALLLFCLHGENLSLCLLIGSWCLCKTACFRPSLLVAQYSQTCIYKIITEAQNVAASFKIPLVFLGFNLLDSMLLIPTFFFSLHIFSLYFFFILLVHATTCLSILFF